MADYVQTPHRPNIKPTGLPRSTPPNTPAFDKPIRQSSSMVPALGAVAVVGIVALVAWGVMDNDPAVDNGGTAPAATQTAPIAPADPVAPAVTPDTTATPTPTPLEEPDVTPLEVPTPAPEVVPAPTPVPAPTN